MRTVIEDGVEYAVVDMTWDSASADSMSTNWHSGNTVEELLAIVMTEDQYTYAEIRARILQVMTWPAWLNAPDQLVQELISQGIITQDEYGDSIDALVRKKN